MAFMMRPTTTPSARTSKSSSLHSSDKRLMSIEKPCAAESRSRRRMRQAIRARGGGRHCACSRGGADCPPSLCPGDVVSCAYRMIWGRRRSAARRVAWAVVSNVAPSWGVNPPTSRPGIGWAFFYFGREGRVFLVVSHWKSTMNSIIRLR
jgi:hypothetical protein